MYLKQLVLTSILGCLATIAASAQIEVWPSPRNVDVALTITNRYNPGHEFMAGDIADLHIHIAFNDVKYGDKPKAYFVGYNVEFGTNDWGQPWHPVKQYFRVPIFDHDNYGIVSEGKSNIIKIYYTIENLQKDKMENYVYEIKKPFSVKPAEVITMQVMSTQIKTINQNAGSLAGMLNGAVFADDGGVVKDNSLDAAFRDYANGNPSDGEITSIEFNYISTKGRSGNDTNKITFNVSKNGNLAKELCLPLEVSRRTLYKIYNTIFK